MITGKFAAIDLLFAVLLIFLGFLVWVSLSDRLIDWTNLINFPIVARTFPSLFSEPRLGEIFNLFIFFLSSVGFLHLVFFFLPRVTGLYERQNLVSEKMLISSIDYFWIFAAVLTAVYSVSALTVRSSNENLSRLTSQEDGLIRTAQDKYIETVSLCEANPNLISGNFSTRDRITAVYYPELCSFIDPRDDIVGLSYDYDFLRLCSEAGFEYQAGEGEGNPTIFDPDKVGEEDKKAIEAISASCIYADSIHESRRVRKIAEEEVSSFDGGNLTQDRHWFLIVLFLAALRLTKTTKDIMR